jgi:hypothetical protein
MHTREEYRKARIQLEADSSLLKKLTAAVSWGGLADAAEMASNPSSPLWGWDYSHFYPTREGYEYGDGYGAAVRRCGDKITVNSCGGHTIKIEFSPQGEISQLDTGTEESMYSFGGAFAPEERVVVVAERLAKAGFKINKAATTACIERCRQLEALKAFLGRGPERPSTRVQKALRRWPREVVMTVAAEMWPLSFGKQQAA